VIDPETGQSDSAVERALTGVVSNRRSREKKKRDERRNATENFSTAEQHWGHRTGVVAYGMFMPVMVSPLVIVCIGVVIV
jgi:hypothetical protein